jgi:C4-dicarboxylate-binding protein DctP
MKKALSLILTMCMIFALATAMSPAASADDQIVIKFGRTPGELEPTASREVMYATAFKEYVESHSDTIKVELYPSDTLGSANDVVGAIAAGTVEMGAYDFSLINNYYPETMVFCMPGAFLNNDEVNATADTEWAADLFAKTAEETGIRVLSVVSGGMRCFTTKGHEVKTVEDAKGLTFRVMDSPIYVKMVEAISANPVPMPGSEMYVAMQNGVVDGHENTIPNILQDRTYEVQDWIVMDEHIPSMTGVYFNDALYQKMSDEQRAVIDEAAAVAQAAAREVVTDILANGVKSLEDNGMTVYIPTDAEKEAWHDAYGPACETYLRGQVGDEIVDEFLATIAANR